MHLVQGSRTFIGGKHSVGYFRVAGSDEAIPVGNFNVAEVQQATLAAGASGASSRPSAPPGRGRT